MWESIREFEDIKLESTKDGIAKIKINRPEVRNAFRPLTVQEMLQAFDICRDDSEVGVIILTGEGDKAFCSGGDQRVRGKAATSGGDGIARLNVLDLQSRSGLCPNRWWPWWPDTPWAAATFCTWFAI